jgi:hypothetical protein
LCAFDGLDPNSMVDSGRVEVVMLEEGVAFEQAVPEPAWKAYASEAARLVVAFEAFTQS